MLAKGKRTSFLDRRYNYETLLFRNSLKFGRNSASIEIFNLEKKVTLKDLQYVPADSRLCSIDIPIAKNCFMPSNSVCLPIVKGFHIRVDAGASASQVFSDSFLKQNGFSSSTDLGRCCLVVSIKKKITYSANGFSVDNNKYHIETSSDVFAASGRLTKFGRLLPYKIIFDNSSIAEIHIEDSLARFYDLYCLRIILPAINYNLHNFGIARLKATLCEDEEKLTIIPGFSGAGKTTMALHYIANGGAVLSETFLYVSSDGSLHSCANSIQCFVRNYASVVNLLSGAAKWKYIAYCALSILTLRTVNLPYHIKSDSNPEHIKTQKPLHSLIPPTIAYFNCYEELQLSVDMNEYEVFLSLLNLIRLSNSNRAGLEAFVDTHRTIIETFTDKNAIVPITNG